MKLVCRSCKHEQSVEDRSFNHCPQCGSSNIKIYLFGKPSSPKLNIEEVGFSTRTEKALIDNGIKSVAGLLRFKASALEEKDGIGKKAVQEIKTKLKKLDLSLKE